MKEVWILPCDEALADALTNDLAELGYSPRALPLDGDRRAGRAEARSRPPALLLVATGARLLATAVELCVEVRATEELAEVPLLAALDEGALRAGAPLPDCDELLVAPWSAAQLQTRIDRANQRLGLADDGDMVRLGTLELNLATYQVRIDGEPVDFTYMEYELLRFLITHPNRVFSREALLNRVWGYDFYGGTRTVDVHVRRVRAKLGNEHAARLLTVRSVGYRFER